MTKIFLTPGPTHLHPVVRQSILAALENDIGSISHRSKEFEAIYQDAEDQLKELFSLPEDYQIFFISSGTESWERIIQSGTERKSFHFVNGAFSKKFQETSTELGRQAELLEKPLGQGFKNADIPDSIDAGLLALTLNETSSGVKLEKGFAESLRKKFTDKLIAVDAVSAAPVIDLDISSVDYYFFSVQKYFCMPAGLGVLFASPRAIEKAEKLASKKISIGCHHSLLSLKNMALKNQTPTTPNVVGIYALAEISRHFNKIGLDRIRKETADKAGRIYDFLDKSGRLKAFVQDSAVRSETVITVDSGEATSRIISELAKSGLIVGEGYGKLKQSQFRIANFSAHTEENVEFLLSKLRVLA